MGNDHALVVDLPVLPLVATLLTFTGAAELSLAIIALYQLHSGIFLIWSSELTWALIIISMGVAHRNTTSNSDLPAMLGQSSTGGKTLRFHDCGRASWNCKTLHH